MNERAYQPGHRDFDEDERAEALRRIVGFIDLTTLEATDTEAKVERLCERALRPFPHRPELRVAAVCVYPSLLPPAKRILDGSPVKLASVAGAFPTGLSPLDVKLFEVRRALDLGAQEIDTVILRGAMLEGDENKVFDELAALREACGSATLKVILETGELGSPDLIRRACRIALRAGADFLKTSTGKIPTGATIDATRVMLEAIREYEAETQKRVGIKVAGGIRKADQALGFYELVRKTLGDDKLDPNLFRIGASSLLDDLARVI